MHPLEDIVEIIQMARRGPELKSAGVFNPWADEDPLDAPGDGPDARRIRLLSHFSVFKPKLLLIGEAPGYQGCHYTGVPFVNESLILDGVVPRMTTGRITTGRITTRERPWAEQSASIVWGSLQATGLRDKVVMWNAFPWHPHEPGNLHSNRTPTGADLKQGLHLLDRVIKRFVSDGALIVAVGRKAEASVSILGNRDFMRVRHPSMGGASAFRAGMLAIAHELDR